MGWEETVSLNLNGDGSTVRGYNTQHIPTANTKIEMEVRGWGIFRPIASQIQTTPESMRIGCSITGGHVKGYEANANYFYHGSASVSFSDLPYEQIFTLEDNGIFVINLEHGIARLRCEKVSYDKTLALESGELVTDNPLLIGEIQGIIPAQGSTLQVRYCKIWEGDSLEMDILVLQKTDGSEERALYDKISHSFLPKCG